MGSILSFTPRKAAPKRTTATGADKGIIIFFPGVRYERTDGNIGTKAWPAAGWLPALQPNPLPQT